MEKIQKTDEEWRKELTPEQFEILRHGGTEHAFTGELLHNKDTGVYACAACGNELFGSKTKFDSGSGWPSFWDPMYKDNIELIDDTSHGMHRVEVRCAKCGSHLGHLFDDAPDTPTGQRYCINSASLAFKKEKDD
jgi:peptide-methionine (R)-S-oxide reductase